MQYADLEYFLSVGMLSTMMLGMGATLSTADFRKIGQIPQVILLMLVVQVVISPFIAIGVARLFHLSPGVTLGLVLVAALPGGLCSNLITYLGKGNIALSISATALSSLTCLLTTTIVLRVVGGTDLPAGFHLPTGDFVTEIILFMILPLVVGMFIRRFAVNHHGMIAKNAIRLSVLLMIIFTVAAINSGHIRAAEYGWRPPLAFFLFCCVSLWVCHGIGKILQMSVKDLFTIGVECVVRNVQLGVLIKAILFPPGTFDPIGDAILYTLLVYGGLSIGVAGFEILFKHLKIGLVYGTTDKSRLADAAAAVRGDQVLAANGAPVAVRCHSVDNKGSATIYLPVPFLKSTHEDSHLTAVCPDTNASPHAPLGLRRRETTVPSAEHRGHSD